MQRLVLGEGHLPQLLCQLTHHHQLRLHLRPLLHQQLPQRQQQLLPVAS
jgi:hypothetical protein